MATLSKTELAICALSNLPVALLAHHQHASPVQPVISSKMVLAGPAPLSTRIVPLALLQLALLARQVTLSSELDAPLVHPHTLSVLCAIRRCVKAVKLGTFWRTILVMRAARDS